MSKIFLPPGPTPTQTPHLVDVFLAGSIEMGKAIDWQTDVGQTLNAIPAVGQIYNPRRDDWDSSWVQSIDDVQFSTQVNWELDHIEQSTVMFIHFEPGTMSPISLAELGYVLGRQESFDQFSSHRRPEIIVNCPDGFWRQGNVEIMVDRARKAAQKEFVFGRQSSGVSMYRNMDDAKNALVRAVLSKHKILANHYGFFPFDSGHESQREAKIPQELRGQKIPKGFDLDKYLEEQAKLTKG